VDVPDTVKNRHWMKKFKVRWKGRLDQLEIWMVSNRIEIERSDGRPYGLRMVSGRFSDVSDVE
jgi:hypothetical protein